MKALFSFIAIVFFAWVGVVHILPQTRVAARLHQHVEERLSRELDADVSVGAIDFTLLPRPRLELKGVEVKKAEALLASVDDASVLLNLSALFSKRLVWLEVSLAQPIFYYRTETKNQGRLGQLFQRFHHIKIDGGEVRTKVRQWQNISGQISAGKHRPLSGKVRFLFRDDAYQLDLSLGRLDGGAAPVALEGKLKSADSALILSGFLQGGRDQFAGQMAWEQAGYKMRGTITAVRKGDAYQVRLSEGEGAYQKKVLSAVAAQIHLGLERVQIKNLSATFAGKAHLSQGVISLSAAEISARFNLHTKNFTVLLAELDSGFIIPPHLGEGQVRVEFSTQANQLQHFQAQGKVGKSEVLIKIKDNQLWTRWQADNSKTLAHQFGVPKFLASAQSGKVWLKMTKKDGWSPFAARAQLSGNLYQMKGKMHWRKQAMESQVKLRSTFGSGTGRLSLAQGNFATQLHLKKLVLSEVRQDAALRWLGLGLWQGSFDIKAERLLLGKNKLSAFSTQGYVKKQNFRVRHLRGNFASGSFEAAADVAVKQGAPHYTLAFKLKNMESKTLTAAFALPAFVEGKTNLTLRLSTFGRKKQWLHNLNGRGEIVLTQGKLIGFDAALLNQSLPQLELFSLLEIVVDYAFNHGNTSLEYGRSQISIQQGKLTASPVRFDKEHLKGSVQFSADLAAKKLSANFHFKMPLRPQYPALGWRVEGNWNAPQQKFDSIGFEKALARDIITGGINEITSNRAIYILPLPLQDLLLEARKKKNLVPLDLELQMDLTSQLSEQ